MHGGTFQSYWSFLVGFREGDRRICGGGEPGPFGSFLCLCMGGIKGSIWTVSILATLSFSLLPLSPLEVNLTISLVVFPNFWILVPNAASFFTPNISSIFYLTWICPFYLCYSEGLASYSWSTNLFLKLCAISEWLFLYFFTNDISYI